MPKMYKIYINYFFQYILMSMDNDDHILKYIHHNLYSDNLILALKIHILHTF